MRNSAQDPGVVRWFYLTPDALWRVPADVRDPLAWVQEQPRALVLRRENQVVWRRDQNQQRHLAVVR